MGQSRQTVREVSLEAAGGVDTLRVWDAPVSEPIQHMTIWVTSNGQILAAGNLSWDVIYGGSWSGAPFEVGGTHINGVSQGAGNLAGGVELCGAIYEDATSIPSNKNLPTNAGIQPSSQGGFPIVVELTNMKVVPVNVRVVFVSRSISDKV